MRMRSVLLTQGDAAGEGDWAHESSVWAWLLARLIATPLRRPIRPSPQARLKRLPATPKRMSAAVHLQAGPVLLRARARSTPAGFVGSRSVRRRHPAIGNT